MAGLVAYRIDISRNLLKNIHMQSGRWFSSTSTPGKIVTSKIESMEASLSSKGFLRPIKSYSPPPNVSERIKNVCSQLKISATNEYKLTNLEQKFQFLSACQSDFQYSVPNSQVHEMITVGDVTNFYETSIDTTIPFDALKKLDLPENLHIQYDYLRFHPDTDTKFNGISAFPKSSTLVTGLKYREKYKGYQAKRSWP